MYKAVGMGLILLIGGCASVGTKGQKLSLSAKTPQSLQVQAQEPDKPDLERECILAEIKKYHAWLQATGQLLRPLPHYKGWPEPRELMEDPDNPGHFIPKPEPPPPTAEERKKMLEDAMKDPAFRKALKEHKGPRV